MVLQSFLGDVVSWVLKQGFLTGCQRTFVFEGTNPRRLTRMRLLHTPFQDLSFLQATPILRLTPSGHVELLATQVWVLLRSTGVLAAWKSFLSCLFARE